MNELFDRAERFRNLRPVRVLRVYGLRDLALTQRLIDARIDRWIASDPGLPAIRDVVHIVRITTAVPRWIIGGTLAIVGGANGRELDRALRFSTP